MESSKIDLIEEKLNLILKELKTFKANTCVSDTSVEDTCVSDTRVAKEIKYESTNTEELNTALASASLEFPEIKINRENPYLASGYADLHIIMCKVRSILGKYGLHLTHIKKLKDGATFLATRLWHSSGQWIESRVLLNPSKNSIEAYGSNLNSMKRFEAMDILNLTVSGDPFDDDGEADSDNDHKIEEAGSSFKALYNKKEETFAVINKSQYIELMKELDSEESLAEDILDKLHIRSLRDLPSSRFNPTIDRIRKIKRIRMSGN